jgi:hypothetical protein
MRELLRPYTERHPRKSPVTTPMEERLAARIDYQGDDQCWEWRGWRDRHGYGRIDVKRVSRLAHRIAYEILIGPIPDGLELDHLCRNTSCVNPAHLEPVTHRENMGRGTFATKTHCPAGHLYAEHMDPNATWGRVCS